MLDWQFYNLKKKKKERKEKKKENKKLDLVIFVHSTKWPDWTHSDNFKTQTKKLDLIRVIC